MSEYWQIITWQPNQQLDNGKYTIADILGGGGFGKKLLPSVILTMPMLLACMTSTGMFGSGALTLGMKTITVLELEVMVEFGMKVTISTTETILNI